MVLEYWATNDSWSICSSVECISRSNFIQLTGYIFPKTFLFQTQTWWHFSNICTSRWVIPYTRHKAGRKSAYNLHVYSTFSISWFLMRPSFHLGNTNLSPEMNKGKWSQAECCCCRFSSTIKIIFKVINLLWIQPLFSIK